MSKFNLFDLDMDDIVLPEETVVADTEVKKPMQEVHSGDPALTVTTPAVLASANITGNLMKSDAYCPIDAYENTEGGKTYHAYIIGEVSVLPCYTALIDTLVNMTENDKAIIYIDSPGGYVSTGAIISSAIHHCRGEVYTSARGFCASAAALIHSSAKKECELASDFSVLMYHMSAGADRGYTTLVANRAKCMTRYVNECLLKKTRDEGHITDTEFERIQNGDEIYITGVEFKKRQEGQGSDVSDKQPKVSPNDALAGTESLAMSWKLQDDERVKKPINLSHHIFTSDEKNYRLYLPQDCNWTPASTRNICRFIDRLSADNTLTIYMGSDGDDGGSYLVSAILSSVVSCKAKTIAVAAGPCSVAETMIWTFANERVLQYYGYLRFGINAEFLKTNATWNEYYALFLNRAKELNIITDDDVMTLQQTGGSKVVLYSDLNS